MPRRNTALKKALSELVEVIESNGIFGHSAIPTCDDFANRIEEDVECSKDSIMVPLNIVHDGKRTFLKLDASLVELKCKNLFT